MATITSNAGIEIVPRKVVHELGKHELTGEHGRPSIQGKRLSPSGFCLAMFRSCAPIILQKT
jgi:hypothetical protein